MPELPSLRSPPVSVVIVSFNTLAITLACLRALFDDLASWNEGEVEVWVADNASGDGSAQAVAAEFPEVLRLELRTNVGFGPANNAVFEKARGEFFFLLNSDAFVHAGALRELVEYLRAHPDVGAVGPRLLNADGTLQASCWPFPSPGRAWLEATGLSRVLGARAGDLYRWAHDEERDVEFAIGAALLVRRRVWEQIGGFDPAFFLYAEEADWQKRMHDAGWGVAFWPRALVTHLGGASGASDAPRTSHLFWQGQERYILKHFGAGGFALFRAGLAVGALLRWLGFIGLAHHPRHRRRALGKARFFGWQLKRVVSTGAPPREGASS